MNSYRWWSTSATGMWLILESKNNNPNTRSLTGPSLTGKSIWSVCSEANLSEVCNMWTTEPDLAVDMMVKDLVSCVQECVEATATMRTVTQHSRPWIDSTYIICKVWRITEVEEKVCRLRRSPANVTRYKKFETKQQQWWGKQSGTLGCPNVISWRPWTRRKSSD